MTYETKLTVISKGRRTLPAELRERWNVEPGDKLHIVLRDDGVAEITPRKLTQPARATLALPDEKS